MTLVKSKLKLAAAYFYYSRSILQRHTQYNFRLPKDLVMTKSKVSEQFFNGAKCKSYCWSQSHSDLEICIKLTHNICHKNVSFHLTPTSIRVDLIPLVDDSSPSFKQVSQVTSVETLLEGEFEHRVSCEAAYWLLDADKPSIVIYLDKVENMWWKQLLLNEEVTEAGSRNYTIAMDLLDDGSRMAIDKLIVEQRNKLISPVVSDLINLNLVKGCSFIVSHQNHILTLCKMLTHKEQPRQVMMAPMILNQDQLNSN